MASPSSRGGGGRVVGEYMIGRRIGSGAFSEVWLGRHRVRGTEVAVKEIVMERMSKKLQDSLLSEVFFLRNINHPNVIALHDFIQVGLFAFPFFFFLVCFCFLYRCFFSSFFFFPR